MRNISQEKSRNFFPQVKGRKKESPFADSIQESEISIAVFPGEPHPRNDNHHRKRKTRQSHKIPLLDSLASLVTQLTESYFEWICILFCICRASHKHYLLLPEWPGLTAEVVIVRSPEYEQKTNIISAEVVVLVIEVVCYL